MKSPEPTRIIVASCVSRMTWNVLSRFLDAAPFEDGDTAPGVLDMSKCS
jgi:hypothetical protein